MKKIIMLFAAAALVLGSASCQKENFSQEVTPGEEKIDYSDDPMGVIKVYIKKDDTKMGFEEKDNKLYRSWEKDDVIDGCTKVGDVFKSFAYTVAEVGVDGEEKPYILLKKMPGEVGVPSSKAGTKVNFVYAPGAVSFDATTGACSLDLSKQDESHIPAVMVASGEVGDADEQGVKLTLDFENIAAVIALKDESSTYKDIENQAVSVTGINKAYVKARSKGVLTLTEDGYYTLSDAKETDFSQMLIERDATTWTDPIYVAALPGNGEISVTLRTDKGKFAWKTTNKLNENGYARIKNKEYTQIAEAQIGAVRYAIEDAFDEANGKNEAVTIELVENATPLEELMVENNNVVLDLKGKTITCTTIGATKCRPHVKGDKTMEITDSSSEDIAAQGKIVPAAGQSFTVAYATDASTLKISGGTIENENGNAVYVDGSKLDMTGGKVNGKSSTGAVTIINASDTEMASTLSGGEIVSDTSNGLYVAGNVKLTVSGGKISYTNSAGTNMRGGLVLDSEENGGEGEDFVPTVNINGGEIQLTSAGAANSYAAVYVKGGKLNVNGGIIKNDAGNGCAIRIDDGAIVVNGKNHPDYIDDGENNPNPPSISNNGSWGCFLARGGETTLYTTATYSSESNRPIGRFRGGIINIKGGTFKSGGTNGVFFFDSGGEGSPTVNMTGGLVYAVNKVANVAYPVVRLECGQLNLSGGRIGKIGQSGSDDAREGSYRAITMSDAKLKMTGGSLLGGRNAIYAQGNSDIEIQSGEVVSSLTGTSYYLINLSKTTDKASISGGKFATGNATTPIFKVASGANLEVTGGKYTANTGSPVINYIATTHTTNTISESLKIDAKYSTSGTAKTFSLTTEVVENE